MDEQNDITLKESCRQRVIMAKHRSLRTEQYKLLYRPTLSGVTWSLYDLQHDPDEQHDVIDDPAHHDAATTLKQQLRGFLEADRDFFLEHDLLIARKPTGREVCVK